MIRLKYLLMGNKDVCAGESKTHKCQYDEVENCASGITKLIRTLITCYVETTGKIYQIIMM